jgi:hypothetical protein
MPLLSLLAEGVPMDFEKLLDGKDSWQEQDVEGFFFGWASGIL